MKLDFLDDLSDGGKYASDDVYANQIMRLYDFDKNEAVLLRSSIQSLILDGPGTLRVSKLPFVESTNCTLTLRVSEGNEGVKPEDNGNFDCYLNLDGYRKMIDLMEPFCEEEPSGYQSYQWLYDLDCDIDFLFSYDGSW